MSNNQIYRVHTSSEQYFHFQIDRHKLVNATILISNGALHNYSIYINPDVKVYLVKSSQINLAAIESDFELNPPTKDTFKKLGNNEIFI